ncbi:MFS transporter [Abyssisolibacter fermentans]|uniref:MFS transporter n=1 Tax=Abyssisolibacter fermentans TaxID=1766203 RepID=UPI0008331743|nr:MFS transporter [Abyssisolibacter fermentans]
MKNSKFQKYFTLFVICLGAGLLYKVPYLREAFYTPLKEALNATHEQVGALSSIYGTVALFSYIPGGILADKISTRALMVFSFISTGLLTLWFAMMPPYPVVKLIYGLMGVTTILTFWSAFVKTIRLLGGESEQGKMFGLSEGIRSVGGTIGSFIVLGIIANAATQLAGLQVTLLFYGSVYIVVGILCIFFIPADKKEKDEKKSIFSVKEIKEAIKLPGLWLVSLLIFAWYCIYSAQSYTTPYLTEIYGLPLSVVGSLSIMRSYGMGIFAGPLAGVIGDKIGSPTRVLIWGSIAAIILTVGFIVFPVKQSLVMIPMILMIVLSFIVYSARGTYFATMADAGIPIALTGIASGLISIIGYSPDMFLYTMAGKWLDNNSGVAGYRYIFIFMIVCAIVALIASLAILRLSKKNKNTKEIAE